MYLMFLKNKNSFKNYSRDKNYPSSQIYFFIYIYIYIYIYIFPGTLTKSKLSISFRKLFPTSVHFLHSILTRQPLAVHIAMEHPAKAYATGISFQYSSDFFSPLGINQIYKI
jgi:hypothetical protein